MNSTMSSERLDTALYSPHVCEKGARIFNIYLIKHLLPFVKDYYTVLLKYKVKGANNIVKSSHSTEKSFIFSFLPLLPFISISQIKLYECYITFLYTFSLFKVEHAEHGIKNQSCPTIFLLCCLGKAGKNKQKSIH